MIKEIKPTPLVDLLYEIALTGLLGQCQKSVSNYGTLLFLFFSNINAVLRIFQSLGFSPFAMDV